MDQGPKFFTWWIYRLVPSLHLYSCGTESYYGHRKCPSFLYCTWSLFYACRNSILLKRDSYRIKTLSPDTSGKSLYTYVKFVRMSYGRRRTLMTSAPCVTPLGLLLHRLSQTPSTSSKESLTPKPYVRISTFSISFQKGRPPHWLTPLFLSYHVFPLPSFESYGHRLLRKLGPSHFSFPWRLRHVSIHLTQDPSPTSTPSSVTFRIH